MLLCFPLTREAILVLFGAIRRHRKRDFHIVFMLAGAARIIVQDSSLKYQAFHFRPQHVALVAHVFCWHVQQGMNLQNVVTACASACPEAPELDARPCWGCAGGCVPPSPVEVSVPLLTLPAAVGLSALRHTRPALVTTPLKPSRLAALQASVNVAPTIPTTWAFLK